MKTSIKRQKRINRHKRARAKIVGTKEVPRISVFRSNKHIQLQAIDDGDGKTLASADTHDVKKGNKTEQAQEAAKVLAEKLKKDGIKQAVFDRGGNKYQGRVSAVADILRKQGIKI